jgi:hypothetical protein
MSISERENKMFTLENTKDATHYTNHCFYISPLSESHSKILENGEFVDLGFISTYGSEAFIRLSRPHNETREYWTNNGVTQYAQPQGNDGDHYEQAHHIALQIEELGSVPAVSETEYLLSSGANAARLYESIAQVDGVELTKPTYEMTEKADAYSYDGFIAAGWTDDQLIDHGYMVATPEKPIFTQAQADANQLPPIGSRPLVIGRDGTDYIECEILMHREIKGYGPVAVFTITDYSDVEHYYSHCSADKFKPIQTDEEKLRSELWDIISEEVNSDSMTNVILHELMNSDKLEIKLKG